MRYLGAFHCSTDEIEIVLPKTLAEREASDFMYRGLEPNAAFASILRHRSGRDPGLGARIAERPVRN